MRCVLRFVVFLWLTLLPAAAFAASRVALVIGMSKYQNVGTLKNTVNDATAVADTLESIGFDVTRVVDAPLKKLLKIMDEFSFQAETSDLALIYYAGHGVEVQGQNFLVPVDADVRSNIDVQQQSVSLKQMLKVVESARKLRIVILDSCRNNPFGDAINLAAPPVETTKSAVVTRGTGGGLAVPSPDRGTLVAFAAKDGQLALDGTGVNSPYAMALVDKFKTPGLEISLMFRQVRDSVLSATGNYQEPHTYGSLSGVPFYLAGPKKGEQSLKLNDPQGAWSQLRPDQAVQLAALADGGDTRSMLGLAYMKLNPVEKARYDPAAAVELLTRAADAGSPEAQFELAKLYEQGLGVSQDDAHALQLYQAAADQNFADAINDLGFLYYQGGLGLPQDKQTALRYFERAADLRHPQAMFNFAALIDDGLVKGKGPQDAANYLYQALRSGSSDVLNLLTERPTMFKDATRKALQKKLKEYAFYQGSIDGDFGPGTKRSIREAFGLKG